MGEQNALLDVDGLLEGLVQLADAKNATIGLTLHVGGILVTGTLAGIREFSRHFGAALTPTGSGESRTDSGEQFARLVDKALDTLNSAGDMDWHPRFIHLRDATLFVPGGATISKVTLPWWRGRLSEVSAFALGELSL